MSVFKSLPKSVEMAKAIQDGLLSNWIYVYKFGASPTVGTAIQTIWDGATLYTYSTSAQTLYCSSTNANDKQTIQVYGLDADWKLQQKAVILNGQTKVAIEGTWMRVFRFWNDGTTDFAGNVYIYENDTPSGGIPPTASKIRAKVYNGNNQTLMTLFTIPEGYRGYLLGYSDGCGRGDDVTIKLVTREYGKVFLF